MCGVSACCIDCILYWHNIWEIYRRFEGWLSKKKKKHRSKWVHTSVHTYSAHTVLYSTLTLLCRFTFLPNQLIITHMTFSLFLIQMLHLDFLYCFALLCSVYTIYIVAYTNHEFIYLISFHVQIENQYHFRSIVCAAGKLEWRFQIGYYIKRERKWRRKNQPEI